MGRLARLLLLGGERVQLQGATELLTVIDPVDAHAGYRLTSGGDEESGTGTTGVTYSTIAPWLLRGSNSDFEVRATLNSGSLSTGTTGSWLALTSTATWTVAQTVVGVKAANLTIEIRDATSLVVLASATVILSATVDP